jgi:nicotinamide-nucleotide amidase
VVKVKSEIINIGTELLMGDTLNTHGQFLSRELKNYGMSVYYHTTIGDNPNRMRETIKNALERSDLIICTAGLGPTQDDLTKEIVAETLGLPLSLNNEILGWIEDFFDKINKPMPDNNKKQALVPKGGIVIENKRGTAPGLIIPFESKHIILMPGPRSEFEYVYEHGVRDYLESIKEDVIYSESIYIEKLGESFIETEIIDLINKQEEVTIATYAKGRNTIEVRLAVKSKNKKSASKRIKPIKDEILSRFDEKYVLDNFDKDPIVAIIERLKKENYKLGTVESCTGGLLSSKITSYSGVSSFYELGLTTYAAKQKIKLLGIEEEVIDKYSVVSEEVAYKMAQNMAERYDLDLVISTTGLAGPGNDGLNLPVGTVFIGVCFRGKTKVFEKHFEGSRNIVQKKIVEWSLLNLFDILGKMR